MILPNGITWHPQGMPLHFVAPSVGVGAASHMDIVTRTIGKEYRIFAVSILASFFLLSLFLLPTSGIVRADGFPIIGVLHAGGRPEGIAVDTSTHMVYVGYEDQGTVVG